MARTKKLNLAKTVTTESPIFSGIVTGSITGNAATVTTNANLTGMVTSVGNATTVVTNANLTGMVTSVGNATTLANTAVTGGVYQAPFIQVDAQGRLTKALDEPCSDEIHFSGGVLLNNTFLTATGVNEWDAPVVSAVARTGIFSGIATATSIPLYFSFDFDETVLHVDYFSVAGGGFTHSFNLTKSELISRSASEIIVRWTGFVSYSIGTILPTRPAICILRIASNLAFTLTLKVQKEFLYTGTSPVVVTGRAISIPAASASVSGHLTSADWTTFNNKASIATSALAITYAGTWNKEYLFVIVPANNFQQSSNGFDAYSGKWIRNFTYTEIVVVIPNPAIPLVRLTSLTFTDLEGVEGAFSPSIPGLTTLSLPALKVVGGFSPAAMSFLTNLSIPELKTVNGDFSPGTMAITTLSAPKLKIINGSFAPTSPLLSTSTVSFPELETILSNFTLSSTLALTVLSIPKLKEIGGTFTGSNSLINLSAPLLERVVGGITISSTALTTLSLPLLVRCGSWSLTATVLTAANINVNSLISVSANFSHTTAAMTAISYPALTAVIGSLTLSGNTAATSVSFPALATVGSLNCSGGTNTTSFNLNALTACQGGLTINYAKLTSFAPTVLTSIVSNLTLTGCNLLTTLSLPAMVSYNGSITATSIPVLTTVTIGTIGVLKILGSGGSIGNISFSGCNLNQASVDGILALLVSLDGTGGKTLYGASKTVTLNGGTNSTPSPAGAANRLILVGRGAIVNVN